MASKRTVLITGAAGGVGRATVELFLQQGWQVLGIDIKKSPEPPLPNAAVFVTADVSFPIEVDTLHDELASQLGNGLNALINNAAVQITKPLTETTVEEWDRVHAVNLRAPYLLAKAFYPAIKKAKGTIVNVSSVHALATSADIGAYASTKGGLLALTPRHGD